MTKRIRLTGALLFVCVAVSAAIATDYPYPPNAFHISTKGFRRDPIKESEWNLCMINDGELCFLRSSGESPGDPKAVPLPKDDRGQIMRSNIWEKKDGVLQITVEKYDAPHWKAQAAKNGWYLSADYSVDPPTAALTKDRSKTSKWTFVKAEGPSADGEYFYLKNDNDLAKDAWLALPDKGTLYKGGYEARATILSFEKSKRVLLYFEQPSP